MTPRDPDYTDRIMIARHAGANARPILAEALARIGNAFDGIDHENMAGRNEPFAVGLGRMGRQRVLPLTLDTLVLLADRINELSAIVQQNALTADDAPQAGWGIPAAPALECCECGDTFPALSPGGRCVTCELSDDVDDYICGECGEPRAPASGTCGECVKPIRTYGEQGGLYFTYTLDLDRNLYVAHNEDGVEVFNSPFESNVANYCERAAAGRDSEFAHSDDVAREGF